MIGIAIDGPGGAGKSTIAKTLAKKLGFVYVDTGAIYRTVGLYMSRIGIAPEDAAGIEQNITGVHLGIRYENGEQKMLLDGTDVSDAIRTPLISKYASCVSAVPAVRDFLFVTQRELAKKNNVIMDGRDIGTVILPDADVKIFLTASPEARARRRAAQLECRTAFLADLIPGDIIRAKVTHLEQFGAFVDIGCGIPSLLTVDCISVSRISRPADRFTVGEYIPVVIRSIDRENDRAALRTILKAIQFLKEDKTSIAVFPEGYTSKTGELNSFRNGAFKIAQKAGVPIVVCVLSNTPAILKNMFRRHTDVYLDVLDIIPADELNGVTTAQIGSRIHDTMTKGISARRKALA